MHARQPYLWSILLAAACTGAGFMAATATAQGAVLQSFDQVFQGDDPTQGFDFNLPLDASTPVMLQFQGYAENLDAAETGVRFLLIWQSLDGNSFPRDEFPSGNDFFSGVRLPPVDAVLGTTQVPLSLVSSPGYTPAAIRFVIEGLGPADNFRIVGDLTVQAVPEPSAIAIAACGAIGLLLVGRRARRCA